MTSFTSDCPIAYSTTVVTTSGSTSDLTFFQTLTDGNGLNWSSALSSDVGTYRVTVSATSGCDSTVSAFYDVTILDTCSGDSLSIDNSVFITTPSNTIDYTIGTSGQTITWTDAIVTSTLSVSPATCGGLSYSITN